ncbi:hypothetical protein SAMN05428988_0158 [Chitinophaga sp. YR573]|uniref:hypothetical protein n=1 Tax=Chitinophaga sp. YR573 TaxID=1881040 RepID=UPI0008AEE8E0|nr:hypothetical protein [Chitinophaga sp. YR573]SEV88928.1 hypothetical protein SAMN05428988_0158 [Chitinophaga sp. YR573]
MAGKARIGLKKIEFGDVAGDGGMGTALTEFGATVSDTAVLSNDSPNVTDFNIEEQTAPFFTATVDGKLSIKWSSYNVEPAALVRVKGGTVTVDASGNNTWNKPADTPNIEVSCKVTMKDGTIIQIPRGNITAVFQWNLQKNKLAQVDLTLYALLPTKDNTPEISITTPS